LTGRMLFMTPNQQCQSIECTITEGTLINHTETKIVKGEKN